MHFLVGVAIGYRFRYVNNNQLIFYYAIIILLARNTFRLALALSKPREHLHVQNVLRIFLVTIFVVLISAWCWWEITARMKTEMQDTDQRIQRIFTHIICFAFLRDKVYCYANTTNDCIIMLHSEPSIRSSSQTDLILVCSTFYYACSFRCNCVWCAINRIQSVFLSSSAFNWTKEHGFPV